MSTFADSTPLPPDEQRRIEALRELGILDTPPEDRFDRITRLATRLFQVPIALITLVDVHRQWFKSCQGLTVSETPRSVSFCAHAIRGDETLVIPDTLLDPRFAENPVVTGEPAIRFYAGHPLKGPSGQKLGTLCLLDRRPRTMTVNDLAALHDLAAWAEQELNAFRLDQALALHDHERLRLLESVVVHANDAVLITEGRPIDPPGPRILYVNEAFTRMTGYRSEEVLGKTPRVLQSPRTDRATLDQIRSALTRWEPIQVELVNLRKDGSEFWVDLSIVPAGPVDDWYTHWISIQRDVTERRGLEQLKNDLLAVVSHDLRSPLALVVGYAELLLTGDYAAAERRELLQTIADESQRLTELVDDFLDIQRMESGAMRVEPRPVELSPLLERAVRADGGDPACPISLDIEEVPPILSDPKHLLQVVTNLLSNARKYSPAGGEIRLTARTHGATVEVSVRDHGLGIPPEALPHLFEKFYRVDTHDRAKIPGSGLGLAICRKIVEAYGGRIWVESDGPGQGSTVTFSQPRV